jgi:hypothetical protein
MSEHKKPPHEAGAPPQHPSVPSASLEARTARIEETIWGAIDEIWAAVPEEDMRKLPTDLAAQLDHYVYGLPKRAK